MPLLQSALQISACTLFAYALAACSSPSASSPTATESVEIGGETFQLQLALNEAARQKGLGGVASLAKDGGMLFVFTDAAPRSFWMYGCIMDIDIAYVGPLGRVLSVYTMPKEPLKGADETEDAYRARLAHYPSMSAARYVIEVAPGTFERLGVKVGTMLELDRERLKTLAR
jgi:uncharacterized protein